MWITKIAQISFHRPVIIEVPHFAALRGKEREIVILRSDNGETWREHTLEATEDAVQEVLQESFDADGKFLMWRPLLHWHTLSKQIWMKSWIPSKRLFRTSILRPKGSEKLEMKILWCRKQELPAKQCQPISQPWVYWLSLVGW